MDYYNGKGREPASDVDNASNGLNVGVATESSPAEMLTKNELVTRVQALELRLEDVRFSLSLVRRRIEAIESALSAATGYAAGRSL